MRPNFLFFLIDDDIDDQEVFELALKDIDGELSFIKAYDGREALDILNKDETFLPDFIFLDLNMPRISGKECLTEMRKMARLQNVPIYIYSTSSSEKDKTETHNLGATGFITKPYIIDDLEEILSEIILTVTNKTQLNP